MKANQEWELVVSRSDWCEDYCEHGGSGAAAGSTQEAPAATVAAVTAGLLCPWSLQHTQTAAANTGCHVHCGISFI